MLKHLKINFFAKIKNELFHKIYPAKFLSENFNIIYIKAIKKSSQCLLRLF